MNEINTFLLVYFNSILILAFQFCLSADEEIEKRNFLDDQIVLPVVLLNHPVNRLLRMFWIKNMWDFIFQQVGVVLVASSRPN